MSEHLSWNEAEAVVRAYRAENGAAADVDIDTLARTLGTSPAEVRRLASMKRRFIDRSGVLSATLAFAAVGIAAFAVAPHLQNVPFLAFRSKHSDSGLTITKMGFDGKQRVYVLDNGTSPASTDLWIDPSGGLVPPPSSEEKIL